MPACKRRHRFYSPNPMYDKIVNRTSVCLTLFELMQVVLWEKELSAEEVRHVENCDFCSDLWPIARYEVSRSQEIFQFNYN